MYSLFIQNASCTKDKVHSLTFPGLTEIGEPPVAVRAICVDGEFMFHVVDIMYIITKYANGRTGNTLVHVKSTITFAGGRGGFGKVFWFRRGVYADIQALQSLARAILSDTEDACEYARISYHAAYEALMSCDVQKYQGNPVPAKARHFYEDFVKILPGSLISDKTGVFGTPMTIEESATDDEHGDADDKSPVQAVKAAVSTEQEDVDSIKIDTRPQALDASMAGLYAFDKLLSLLVGGRKLVLTLEVK